MELLENFEKRHALRMGCIAAVLLGLSMMGHSAPVGDCDRLIEPVTISKEDIVGKWLYIGGSSNLPGSRSLGRLMTSVWLDVTATAQRSVLNIIQTQKVYGTCSSLTYSVTFEHSTMIIEQPFYLREVYLGTTCPDCLVAYEEVISGNDTFTSLMLFTKSQSVAPDVVETFKQQAQCLRLPSPIMMDPNVETCPDGIQSSEGLTALNHLLEAKMGHRVARLLDTLFDWFVN